MTETVTPLHPAPQPQPDPQAQLNAALRTINTWRRILALRLIIFASVLGAIGIWAYAAIDPTQWRFIVACGYSAGVLVPALYLYLKRTE